MAEYALQKVPKGNYVMVYGDSSDNNSLIMKKAQMEVLQPAEDREEIKIVVHQHAKGYYQGSDSRRGGRAGYARQTAKLK